jgi:hypothetical protein
MIPIAPKVQVEQRELAEQQESAAWGLRQGQLVRAPQAAVLLGLPTTQAMGRDRVTVATAVVATRPAAASSRAVLIRAVRSEMRRDSPLAVAFP